MRIASISKISLFVAACSVLAAPAMAAPEFSGPSASPLSVSDFASQVSVFNPDDITNLLQANSVAVVSYGSAWSDTDDNSKAASLLGSADFAITRLRTALSDNSAAVALLARNDIPVNRVVNIYDRNGEVAIYVQ